MLELTIDHWDFLSVDTDEWIADRTDGLNVEANKAMDHAIDNGLTVEEWLEKIGATGIYGEGSPTAVNTYNEDNFLSRDLGIILAHTEKYGDLFIWAYGDAYGYGSWIAYTFNGDDDGDAYDYGSGYATCTMNVGYKNGGCDAEWIIESGCYIWNNGGRGGMYDDGRVRISDTLQHDDLEDINSAVCPRCRYGNLTFWSN